MSQDKIKEALTESNIAKIIIALDNKGNCSHQDLSYEIRTTYYWVHTLVKKLSQARIIRKGKKDGRESKLTLTEKGKKISRNLKEIRSLLEQPTQVEPVQIENEVNENGKSREYKHEE